nr:MAG TPA: hypothetical protein [Caudoviricetes sp.]
MTRPRLRRGGGASVRLERLKGGVWLGAALVTTMPISHSSC